MQIIKESWTITEIKDQRDAIDPRPQYQRTLVWDLKRKQLLIDSILRGYDIPKIYLNGKNHGDQYKFEVTDGQQRLNAILEFYDGVFKLPKNTKINGVNLGEVGYEDLSVDLKKDFDDFGIHVAMILKCEPWELNDLFTRLQKGVSLIPVELRNAMMGEIRDAVQKILNHDFFTLSKIDDKRFKRQDYIDHGIAECHYAVKGDLKAPTLFGLYNELSEDKDTVKKLSLMANRVLSIMKKINLKYPGLFKNKWGFVDTFSVIYRNIDKINDEKIGKVADILNEFEKERKTYVSKSDELLKKENNNKFKTDLYEYIQAFNREGAFKYSVEKRYKVMEKIVLKSLS